MGLNLTSTGDVHLADDAALIMHPESGHSVCQLTFADCSRTNLPTGATVHAWQRPAVQLHDLHTQPSK